MAGFQLMMNDGEEDDATDDWQVGIWPARRLVVVVVFFVVVVVVGHIGKQTTPNHKR